MAFELITGRAGRDHVTSDDIGVQNALLFGAGRYVLDELKAQVVDSNTLHVDAFNALVDGRHFRCSGEGVELKISNGTQNRSRIDLVIMRYELQVNGGDFVEEGSIAVIEGEQVIGDAAPVEPTCAGGSILSGDHFVEIPLFSVRLNGTEVIFEEDYRIGSYSLPIELGGTGRKTPQDMSELMRAMFDENLPAGKYFALFDDDDDGGYVNAKQLRKLLGLGESTDALAPTYGGTGQTSLQAARNAMGLGNTTGALPVANGGTGANNAANARTNLGISNAVTAEGNSGIWHYRKYSNGYAEAWGSVTFTPSGMTNDNWRWLSTSHASTQSLPFTFKKVMTADVSYNNPAIFSIIGVANASGTYTSVNATKIQYWCISAVAVATSAEAYIYVCGTY